MFKFLRSLFNKKRKFIKIKRSNESLKFDKLEKFERGKNSGGCTISKIGTTISDDPIVSKVLNEMYSK